MITQEELKPVLTDFSVLNNVNWEEQWRLFAPNFKNGKAHIDLGSAILQLIPGAGFGDLSHPTTKLMLDMLASYVPGEFVVDIGTGSGILSLAALYLGAKKAIGIDIDEEALAHAKQNAKLNQFENKILLSKSLPKKLSPSIFLMNMILSEQQEVGPSKWNRFAKFWITSGILKEQKEKYLQQAKLWGWTAVFEKVQGDWMGWVFKVE